jgi:hypothetical protein
VKEGSSRWEGQDVAESTHGIEDDPHATVAVYLTAIDIREGRIGRRKTLSPNEFRRLRTAFVRVAEAYGNFFGIEYETWREAGVDDETLRAAGIVRSEE